MKPKKLKLYMGGYLGNSYSVELKRGALVYTRWGMGFGDEEEKRRIKPSPEAWQKFWDRLDELGVWSWGGSYMVPWILDGTNWSVEVSVGERLVEADGCNGYPPSSPRAKRPRESGGSGSRFNEFCEAVSELLGGPAFG